MPRRIKKNKIRELRLKTGLQFAKDLAKKANISQPFLSQLENNEVNLNSATARKLAKHLKCDWMDLYL